MKARVVVMPKNDVLDPQGRAVAGALHSLGFNAVDQVRVGKIIDLDLGPVEANQAREQLEKMCNKLLANTVIEDFSFEILE